MLWLTLATAQAQSLKADVTLEGIGKTLSKELKPVSSIARNPERYNALAPLRRAAEADALALTAALQSKGYYAATVRSDVSRQNNTATVIFTIDRGELFTITGYKLSYVDEVADDRPADFAALDLKPKKEPTGAAIKKLQDDILLKFWSRGFLGADSAGHEVKADFSNHQAEIIFHIQSGKRAFFGSIEVQGLERTDPDYVRMFRTFEEGQLASRTDIDTYKERLSETGLFTEIDLQPQLPDAEGRTTILARLSERKHRTLGGGLAFATDIGPTASAFWENRNFLRRGETLRASIAVSAPVQEASASFQKTRPRLPGYYGFDVILRNEDTEAYNAQTVSMGSSLGKLWADRRLTTEGGVRFQYSAITERQCFVDGSIVQLTGTTACADVNGTLSGDEVEFRAISTPLTVTWDSQDDPLDPQQGLLARGNITPFFGTVGFTKVDLAYHDRVFWGEQDGGTFAGRLHLGAIYGASRADIPATERFFAGGGGSIRGYAFQEASPIDPTTADILGGASLVELNLELRQHVTDAIELAVFTDAGGAFEANTPDFEQVLVGAGVGIRYHTPLGPVRLDVAIPLEKRTVVASQVNDEGAPINTFDDEAFHFYIALGQPF
ncbi:MAG: BamA/TamA family outer membrane protein [Parvularculaceae bacterium]|nr:BamA/TamA family outer membrane protein [Parvularculaceae bacterium]